jgi:hypothetical protein
MGWIETAVIIIVGIVSIGFLAFVGKKYLK